MDAERMTVAQACLKAAHDGSLSFPEIVGRLIAAGFEGYAVDYRAHTQTYYLPDADSITLDSPAAVEAIAATFDATEIKRLIVWAQANPSDYSYVTFSQRAMGAGCAGYLVSFSGRRVLYYGRTAETHVEVFPS
ncbi:DUF1398 domain-containing protein [Agrobacterium larrymoorei]|uniref:DUF1398 domain-containing protein n=1 Tax=Agrobacterium larrymoorei TaxID=160699 RepID=UPI0030BF463F